MEAIGVCTSSYRVSPDSPAYPAFMLWRTSLFSVENALLDDESPKAFCDRHRHSDPHPVISTGATYPATPITTRIRVIFLREVRSQSYYSPAATIMAFDARLKSIGGGPARGSKETVMSGVAEGIANDIRNRPATIREISSRTTFTFCSSRNGQGRRGS